jgi:hypothetical protein
MLNQIAHAVIDLFTAPALLIAFGSPLRHGLLFQMIENARAEELNRPRITPFEPDDFQFYYNFKIRIGNWKLGLLGLADFLILPMLLSGTSSAACKNGMKNLLIKQLEVNLQ